MTDMRAVRAVFAAALLAWSFRPVSTGGPRANGIVVRDAWVRESTRARTVSAAYVAIENHTARELTLIGVAVDGARRADLHAATVTAGDTAMRRTDAIRIPPQATVELAPGASHVMLFDIDPPLERGRTVNMTLLFDGERQARTQAVVRPLGAEAAR